jgi:hypothetical protein
MHRLILGLPVGDPRLGDHINRNRLDNRRSNLRIVDRAGNGQNVGSRAGSTSSFRGVSWDSRNRKWSAQCMLRQKLYHLGRYTSEIEAARAAAAFRAEHMPFAVE